MGRGPNSFAEWMLGQNFRSQLKQPSSSQSPILRVELSEDEVSGEETVAITYPRQRRRAAQQAAPGPSSSRKVRFDGGNKPLKSAMKKAVSPNDSDTLVDTSDTSESDATTTTNGADSDADESDTSEDEVPIRRRKSKSRKVRVALCKKDTDSEDSSAAKDALPHETCDCKECVKGRKILKAVIKFEAKREAAEREAKAKEEASKKETKNKSKSKHKDKKDEATSADAVDTNQPETTDAETTETDTTADDKQKGKNKKDNENEGSSPQVTKAVNKVAFRLPRYPKEMQPNLIMPVRTKVMQVEHAMEGPNDPRPNAFFDASKGIARVYHGPKYGNHMGELYGNYNPAKVSPIMPGSSTPGNHGFPPGWGGQPPYGPWYLPVPPPGFPAAGPPPGAPGTPLNQNMPAMSIQVPNNEMAMKEAASKGIGLSGQPASQTPAMIREFIQGEKQNAAVQKVPSENGPQNNGGGWNSSSGGQWGGNGDANNGWNSGGNWDSGSKKEGVSSPHNFGTWDDNNGNKFERQSNKSGSQKDGSQKNGGSGKPDSQPPGSTHSPAATPPDKPADDLQGGGGNAWGQNGNQNSGWGNQNQDTNGWGNDNQDTNGWGQGNNGNGNDNVWGASGDNGEQNQSPKAPHDSSNPKPNSEADNGPQGNDCQNSGGDTWGQNNQNNGWNNSGNDGGGCKNNNTPPQQQQQWNSENNSRGDQGQQQNSRAYQGDQPVWGGPPGSKPGSQRHSRQGSTTGGGNGWQGNSSWGNNDKSTGPSQMPGTWGSGGSRRGSPNGKPAGAFAWPSGNGPLDNNNNNNNNSGWTAPPGSQSGTNGGIGGPPQTVWGGTQQGGGGWDSQNKKGQSPQTGWTGTASTWGNTSNQATGPSTNSWQNPGFAQHTGGKADNW